MRVPVRLVLDAARILEMPDRMRHRAVLEQHDGEREEEAGEQRMHVATGAPPHRRKKQPGDRPGPARRQSPYIFCLSSRRACASTDMVAVGRASSRATPIGSPVSSHQP